ncbi:hypothetical protein FF2_033574 [Malus domestica]
MIHDRIYVVPRPSGFVHQHLALSVENIMKSYVAKCSITASDGSIHENRSLKLHSNTLPPSFLVSKSHHSEAPTLLFPPANQSVAAVVFGDGHESQLYPLKKRRSEGAIPIAANYRLIDSASLLWSWSWE